jgi:ParB family chromosome partitioning protein
MELKMGIKDLKAKTANVTARPVERSQDNEIRTAPVRMYDITQRMHDAEKRAAELEAQLKLAQDSTHAELSLDQLVEVSGRKRNLTVEQFNDLVENLRNNRLVTPISVRRTNTGQYEIISGHNRVAAFRALGRESIPSVIQDDNPVQADLHAFYANLLQPSLPDYEKYLGFGMIKKHHPTMTHEEIADMVGVSRPQVTRLMAFASLPSEALEALHQNPHALGNNAAFELAVAAKAGKHQEVILAVQQLVAGEIDQASAVEQATRAVKGTSAEKRVKPKIEPRVVKQGRATYCSMRRAEKTIRLDFKTPEEAEEVEQAMYAWLEARTKERKEKE